MTFLQLQDRVMGRTNLSSTTARSRVKNFLNERLNRIATTTNCWRVRAGSVSINTVANVNTITTTGLVKAAVVSIPAENVVLEERTPAQLREYDADVSQNGVPRYYAVQKVNTSTLTLQLFPEPDAVYAVVIEGIVTGTDLSADGDIPNIPIDYHDVLIFGALADEFPHLKDPEQAAYYEGMFEKRLSDLKYFIAKSGYLSRVEKGNSLGGWWLAGVWP